MLGLFVTGIGVANLYPLWLRLHSAQLLGQSNEAGRPAHLRLRYGHPGGAAGSMDALADAAGIRLAYAMVPDLHPRSAHGQPPGTPSEPGAQADLVPR